MATEHDDLNGGARPALRPTLAQLAHAAGVNKSTASRALRGDRSIATDTRERIRELAEQLHYEPNASARRLFRARTDVLAIASHSFTRRSEGSDPFLLELLASILHEAATHDLDVLLCRPDRGTAELSLFRRVVGGHHADGFVVMDLRPNDARLDYLRTQGFPHVLFGRPALDLDEARHYPFPWVDVDNRGGARAGVEHLLALGHTRIAYLGCGEAYICDLDRLAGYEDALRAAGISPDPTLRAECTSAQHEGYEATRALLQRTDPPTAIFAASDVLAVGAMHAAQDAGRVVGREFPVMGFDGLGLGTFVTPPLTTLRQPISYVGHLVVQLLSAVLRGEAVAPLQQVLQPELVVRASTGGA